MGWENRPQYAAYKEFSEYSLLPLVRNGDRCVVEIEKVVHFPVEKLLNKLRPLVRLRVSWIHVFRTVVLSVIHMQLSGKRRANVCIVVPQGNHSCKKSEFLCSKLLQPE
jgi:hypothetical protein